MTRRNLELVEPLRGGDAGGDAARSLDRTLTPMGARLLRQLAAVAAPRPRRRRPAARCSRGDGPRRPRTRTAPRGAGRRARPRTARRPGSRGTCHAPRARRSAGLVPPAARRARSPRRPAPTGARSTALGEAESEFDLLADLAQELGERWRSGRRPCWPTAASFAPGYDAELDELRALRDGGKQYIATLQQRERERTGIPRSRSASTRCSATTSRSPTPTATRSPPTTSGGRRWPAPSATSPPELKELRGEGPGRRGADRDARAELFAALRGRVGGGIGRIQRTARVLALLDVWGALAEVAVREPLRAAGGATTVSGSCCAQAATR